MAVTSTLTINTTVPVDVSIDGANVYSVAGGVGSSPIVFPRTITANTTFHITNVPNDVLVSIRRNGLELATAAGERARFNFPRDDGKSLGVASVGAGSGAPIEWVGGSYLLIDAEYNVRLGTIHEVAPITTTAGHVAPIGSYFIEHDEEDPVETIVAAYIQSGPAEDEPDWVEHPGNHVVGNGPPEDGVTTGSTGDLYFDLDNLEQTEALHICTDGATDTWESAVLAAYEIDEPISFVRGSPVGWGGGSILTRTDSGDQYGLFVQNSANEDHPLWVALSD